MRSTNHRRQRLRLAVSSGALAVAMAATGAASAQDAGADATVEEVVVTGFRASLQSAIAAKRNESGVVDVIKAEDIADFPDNNLAESIQRVPGVAITRDAGEGRQVSVRGLGAQFTRVRINGLEGLSTTGGADSSGGVNRGRNFDFTTFASELFNSITIRKTASASVEEGSLGATVDLQTARPFDYKDFTFVLSGQYGYNDLIRSYDPRFAAVLSNTWMDGKLGALVSVAYSTRDLLEEGYNTVRWDNGTSNNGFCSPLGFSPANPAATATTCGAGGPGRIANTPASAAAYVLASAPTSFHPRIPRYARLDYTQERLGITGSLQFRPTDRTLLNFDLLYADLQGTRAENYLEIVSFSRSATQFGKAQTSVREFEVDANGTMVYGVFDGVDVRLESRYDELQTLFRQYTLSGSHEFSDSFKVSGLLGLSSSGFDNPIQTTITMDRANSNSYVYDARGDQQLPRIDYGFDVTDPNAFTFQNGTAGGAVAQSEIRMRPQFNDNNFATAVLDADWQVNDALKVRVGYNWKKFINGGSEYRRASETNVPALPAGVTLASLTEQLTGFGRNLDLPAGTPTAWVVPNLDAFAEAFGIYNGRGAFELSGITNTNARGNWRKAVEESRGLYGMLEFETDVLPFTVRGDLGVRYVETEQMTRGFTTVGTTPVEVEIEREYTDTLPSMNLVAELTDDILVRFAAAKVMSRPQLAALNPGGTIGTVGNRTIATGNPDLDPIRAKTYDLSFEWYFAPESLIAVGLFYKDIESFVQVLQVTAPYNTFGLPDELLAGTGVAPTDTFTFSRPENTQGGPLMGFEIAYQQPFTFLPEKFGWPEWTGGFGTILNYTRVESEIDYCTNAACTAFVTNDLVNLSKTSYNATLYYEREKLSARVSAAYRSNYLTAVPAANAGTPALGRQASQDADGAGETLNVDVAASYAINDRLKLSFEALNLTDQFQDQFNDTVAERVWVHHHTGRQYSIGFRYAF
jgi:TonB-dependent receptor